MTDAHRRSARAGSTLLCGAAAIAVVAGLAGCTTGSAPGHRAAGTRSTPVTSPAAPITTPDTTVATTPSTPASTPRHTPATTAAAPADACTNLTIRVLQGGAVPHQEIAAVTFVNAGTTACTISGYPSVVLHHNGTVLVTATPAPGTVAQAVHLAPGAQAEAQITDHSSCNAPLSDTIEVTAPNGAAGGKLTRPFALRGCTVEVDPVKPSS